MSSHIAPDKVRPSSLRSVLAWLRTGLCASLLLSASSRRAPAILFAATGDSSFNTTAPGGALAGSGWDFQGRWGSFLGTPIAANYFITAGHVGGTVGQTFTLNSISYTSTAFSDDPASDLRIWRVSGTFSTFATLYSGANEVGKSLVVFGRGTQRGTELTLAGGVGGDAKGWLWAASDGVQRWGENVVAGVANGGPGVGQLLGMNFDFASGGNEAHLSTGDSGGGVFILEGGVWKLAGINYAVDGPYNTSASGSGFNAAVFDEGGLFRFLATFGGWEEDD